MLQAVTVVFFGTQALRGEGAPAGYRALLIPQPTHIEMADDSQELRTSQNHNDPC